MDGDATAAQSPQLLEALSDEAFADFQLSNDFAALEKSVEYLQDLINDCGSEDVAKVGRLAYKYARCLQARYERGKDPQEIQNAINFARIGIDNLPPEATANERICLAAQRSCVLSKCLVSQGLSNDCGMPESLEKANTIATAALKTVEAIEDFGSIYALALALVARCAQLLWDRHEITEWLETSLQQTYTLLRHANDSDPETEHTAVLGALSARLLRAYKHYLDTGASPAVSICPKGEGLLEASVRHLQEADEGNTVRELIKLDNMMGILEYLPMFSSSHRRNILRTLTNLLRTNIGRYQTVLQCSLPFDVRNHAENYYDLPRLACAASLESMLPAYDALLILEEGRDIIASQRFDQPVHKHAPDESDGSVTDGLWNLKYGLRDAIANNSSYSIRRQILQRIRTVEGSGQIGTALTAAAIKRLAKGGPIAVINITTVRSDAIIITTSDIISMELPRLDQDSISDLSWKIQRGLAKERPRDRKETARKLRLRITEMLDIIWRSVTKPVLDYLGYKFRDDDVQEWPRVCWVPTGILTLYPIHAAGLGLGEPGNVFNRVVSTYATSLKQLLRKDAQKKSRAQETPSNGPLAAVLSMTITPGRPPKDVWEHPEEVPDPDPWPVLEQSNNEAAVVKTYFPNATIIKQPRAASVLSLLSQSPSLVHFSCHGHVDYIDPSKSLLLFEEQISVASIQELNLRSNAAFLSACFTANSGYEGLQDEPNHMTASLLDAGFDSVIGSLWYVDQEDAPVFTEVYYKYLAGHCDAKIKPRVVAEAFHVAMLEVAKSTRKESNRDIGDPLHWAPFICYGA